MKISPEREIFYGKGVIEMADGLEKFELPANLGDLPIDAQARLRRLAAKFVLEPDRCEGTGEYAFGLLNQAERRRLEAIRHWVNTRRGPELRNRAVPKNSANLK